MCGIFGITDNKEAARLSYIGLFTLQHRGQESAGLAVDDGRGINCRAGMGLVGDVFAGGTLEDLPGRAAIGHVRYSTAGGSSIGNAQPLCFNTALGPVAVAHNGNLTNTAELKKNLQSRGAIFRSTSDSETIIHLMAFSGKRDPLAALEKSLPKLAGAYSFLFMTPGRVIAARDPLGIRPLVIGRLGRSWLFASETCAIEVVGARVVREVEPGELVWVERGRLRSKRFAPRRRPARCVFEQVYFARPDSFVMGKSVQGARYEMGRLLAAELRAAGVKADLVSGVPDSGNSAALGCAKGLRLPYRPVFMRNHYTGRSFIQPDQKIREFTARLKLAPIRDVIAGRTVLIIDDSLVRGTTSRKIVRSLKKAGARKVIMALASPPVLSPCYYGIDIASRKELAARRMGREQLRRHIGADGLHYLSVPGLMLACSGKELPEHLQEGMRPGLNGLEKDFCTACFGGKYPVKPSKGE